MNLATLAGLFAVFCGLSGGLVAAGSKHAPWWGTLLCCLGGLAVGLGVGQVALNVGGRILTIGLRAKSEATQILSLAIYCILPMGIAFLAVPCSFGVVLIVLDLLTR